MSNHTVGGGAISVEADTRDTENSTQVALDECIRALVLAPTHDHEAQKHGSHILHSVLIEAPAILTRNELRLAIDLVQRIAMRRGWMVGNSSNKEKL